jgi:hypothetical protein
MNSSYTMEKIARQQLDRTAGSARRTSTRRPARASGRRGIMTGRWHLVWRPEDVL